MHIRIYVYWLKEEWQGDMYKKTLIAYSSADLT